MKILQISPHYEPNIGGVETHLKDLVSVLIEKKYNVFVLTYRPITTKIKWNIYESKDNLRILRIPWVPGMFYKLVKYPILEFLYLLPGLFFLTPFIIILNNPKVIHGHGLIAGLCAVFWGRLFNKRVIISTHSIYHFPEKGLYTKLSIWIFNASYKVLTLSKQSKKEIEKLKINSDKIKIFTYWIDLQKFKAQSSKLKAKKTVGWGNKFVVLFVGRLVAEKGIPELLEAASKWNKKITLAIAGTGPLESLITGYRSQITNMIYLGKVGNNDLPKYYNAADLSVVPSTHEEGFGRVILESLACGTPVIGSNRGAIPEAMNNSVGELIKITPYTIKNIVEYFYSHPEKLLAKSKNSRRYVENNFSKRNIGAIIKNYE